MLRLVHELDELRWKLTTDAVFVAEGGAKSVLRERAHLHALVTNVCHPRVYRHRDLSVQRQERTWPILRLGVAASRVDFRGIRAARLFVGSEGHTSELQSL